MKFQRIYQAVHFSPWLITPPAHAAIVALLDQKIRGSDDDETDWLGEPLPALSIDPARGIAIVPIIGVMARGVSSIERACGVCDTGLVIEWIEEAVASDLVKSILFVVDSPGGTVDGTAELGEAIAGIEKPTTAWVMSQACSAAYWAACNCDQIYASGPSCEIGSIGVLAGFLDKTKMLDQMGIKVDVMRGTGNDLKAPGAMGQPLTKEQRDYAQSQVDYLLAQFHKTVSENRPQIPTDSMRGQTYFGSQAVEVGMVDGIGNKEFAIRSIL